MVFGRISSILFKINIENFLKTSIGLFCIILAIQQIGHFDFYIDGGFFKNELIRNRFYYFGQFSALDLSSSPIWFYLLNGLQVLLGVILVSSKGNRIIAFGLWVLVVSFQNRNEFILYGGDVAFRMLIACYILLPVSNYIYRFQLWAIYFFTGLLKLMNPVWREGEGILLGLRLEHLATPLGRYASQYSEFLTIGNYLVLVIELVLSAVVLFPNIKLRYHYFIAALFIGMHTLIALLMSVGAFSWIMTLWWIGYIALVKEGVVREKNQSSISLNRKVITATFVAIILLVNVNSLKVFSNESGLLKYVYTGINFIRFDQNWAMFSNVEKQPDGYFLLEKEGLTITPFPLTQFNENESLYSAAFPDHRWVKVLFSVLKDSRSNRALSETVEEWLCGRYVRIAGAERFRLFFKNAQGIETILMGNCRSTDN
ncbi:MAG: hypothetical protein KDD61_18050 [Bdellovibrionales bacterium]|nr:hypothetical protein [Bdellovibrionales bacterium]